MVSFGLHRSFYTTSRYSTAPDWETIHRYTQAVPFTASDDYPKVNGDGDAYDIRDKHVYGDIPTDLEDRTASVTRYYVNAPEPAGWTLNSQGQYVPLYDEPVERQLLTYEVHQVDHNVHHFDPKSITMVTADPEQLEHWRRTGIIDAGQPVIIALGNLREHRRLTMTTQTYQQASQRFLAQAKEELAAGDLQQASEKGWEAAAHMLKAIAE